MHTMHAVLLAAGASSRFGTTCNKLLAPLCGVPLVVHGIRALEQLQIPITVVVGHQREQMMHTISQWTITPLSFAIQEQQQGTGHAVACSRDQWIADTLLVLNGDMPLVTHDIIELLYTHHRANNATISLITAVPDTVNHAYGRVLFNEYGVYIVEAKDFTGDPTVPHPINAGIYLFERSFLEQSIDNLTTNNAHKELYLTDLIGIASRNGLIVSTVAVPFDAVRGVNTPLEFAKAQSIKRAHCIDYWMQQGVLFMMPETVHIDDDVSIGRGTIIHAGVQLRGTTSIGTHCIIDAYSIVEQAELDDQVTVGAYAMIYDAHIPAHTIVTPYTYIHQTNISVHRGPVLATLHSDNQQETFYIANDIL